MNNIGQKLVFIITFILLTVIGRVIFLIPNARYLYILNANDYYVFSCIFIILIIIVLFFIKKINLFRKLLIVLIFSSCVFLVVGIYYYLNLPRYTYEDAIKIIEEDAIKYNNSAKIYIPNYRQEKIAVQKHKFLRMTNYVYYIYVNINEEVSGYRFFPISGKYEEIEHKINIDLY